MSGGYTPPRASKRASTAWPKPSPPLPNTRNLQKYDEENNHSGLMRRVVRFLKPKPVDQQKYDFINNYASERIADVMNKRYPDSKKATH